MNIIGPDALTFGVEDLDASMKFLLDYGLQAVERGSYGGTFAAADGTSLVVRKASDAGLPKAVAPAPNCRDSLYGVADKATLQAIGAELSKDREVYELPNGVLRSTDADGYSISFQVTCRKDPQLPHYGVNVPYQTPGRPANFIAAIDAEDIRPRSLSHMVFFTHDRDRAEKFYAERLGFRTVDVFTNLGPFMRPAGTQEHHTLFLIQAPQLGVQHFTFHLAGANELLKAGWEFTRKGHRSHWGPGRHILGSNYFWYFNSPFGGLMEMDADMDMHDDTWQPRHVPANADTSQTFLLQYADKWSPQGRD